ncbi:hypothetical protein H5J24_10480 [Chryseobacterium capnotolerans]|uniref:SMI1/KNR4 family protein n=1 Tax=Chryseobacterium TaxID=59732 RepID=UPI0009ED8599|nr:MULTISPECIES: SMI1/KNR4 family protein [Chryseobacterium]UHO40358.1 hypothetical protein H5J24_10480 [Chryseobacterium capnotolerans]
MNIQEIFNDNNLKNAVFLNAESKQYNILPKNWQEILNTNNSNDKLKIIHNYWRPFADKLPKIFRIITQDLIDAYIVDDDGQIKMIYIFESNGDIITYQGELPTTTSEFLIKLPSEIADFYKQIHNGWNDSINGGLGFVALDDIKYLDEFEWGILPEIKNLEIDLSKTYYVFHNGAGGYICVYYNGTDFEYLVWWKDEQPTYNINFWSYFDAWVQVNFGYDEL